jgi:hypothetical protein
MNIAKKPYEISLWEEKPVWVRHELEHVIVLESDYKPGKYYSQDTSTTYGEVPWTLDFNEYRDDQRYF